MTVYEVHRGSRAIGRTRQLLMSLDIKFSAEVIAAKPEGLLLKSATAYYVYCAALQELCEFNHTTNNSHDDLVKPEQKEDHLKNAQAAFNLLPKCTPQQAINVSCCPKKAIR